MHQSSHSSFAAAMMVKICKQNKFFFLLLAQVECQIHKPSAHIVSFKVPMENSEVQPPALLPPSPSTKSASIGADLPADGQTPVPFELCICARNIHT